MALSSDPGVTHVLPANTNHLELDRLIMNPEVKVIVCCGSGGVGKTTTAAAMALRAAEAGRKVCVMTIDPAKRLAQSMGLTELDNTPRAVQGIGNLNGGSLDAMMLDMKRTFDEIVVAHAEPERAQAILENPFYQALSSSFAGTQEYMAMEKLGQLRTEAGQTGVWDLIIVDTPPSRSALDFLDAPKRLGSFLDGRMMRLLAAPAKGGGRIAGKIVGAGLGFATGALNKIVGAQVLTDLQTFMASFDTLFGGFRHRAEQTYAQLQAPDTRFIVVAAPEPDALREAAYFVERLGDEDMPLAGLVLNRVTVVPLADLTAEAAIAAADRLAESTEDDHEHQLTEDLLRLHADNINTARRQSQVAKRFHAAHPLVAIGIVPTQSEDIHDLAGLRLVGNLLATEI
ncbi:MAG: ArsA-related P-loop ATPase [Candidatus Nanopelagicales bacterium]